VLCNDASLTVNAKTQQVEKMGEATEAALLTLAEKLHDDGSSASAFRDLTSAQWTKNVTLEFTRKRKSMGVHCTSSTNAKLHNLFVKGAPETVLARSSRLMLSTGDIVALTPQLRATIAAEVSNMSGNESALRCIAFAFRGVAEVAKLDLSDPDAFETVENDLTFVGAIGMLDPPRAEVRGAIEKCRTAGIRVIVITGDNKETAEAICRKIGLLPDGPVEAGLSFTGQEFAEMTPDARRRMIRTARLFSRTDPTHKMALVQLLQDERLIVAMTGDGVNDAPALKKADIGIAMGSGTEVAKAASKMVLADDNFATVVKAVREGRAIYNNTKQFIRYLISSNIGEVVCILITGLLGLPDALAPVQLLWVNLVTDGLPATALGFNAPDPDIMQQAPRRLDEPIVNGWLFFRYLIVGTYVGLATVGGFLWWFLAVGGFTWSELLDFNNCTTAAKCAVLANPETARAIALSILVVVEMFNALNALSENQSIVTVRPGTNKYLLVAIASSMFLHFAIMYVPALAATFSIAPLGVPADVVKNAAPWSILVPQDFSDWKAVLVFSVPVLFIDEGLKLVSRMLNQH
jgi:Ca2+ transporting ATPase